ncbi:MAG: XRE family transcriptional regulator [Paludibacteraceae bacterium]|nr:XRE family transcriptional regulator [Paludibacteraceae bacterium]
MNHIGERIKKKRELLNLQLSDLAKRVGITPSGLSQIEKMKAYPSLFTLKSIADNLHSTVGELIGENDTLKNNPLVKADEKLEINRLANGTAVYQLSHHDINKLMDNFLVKVPASTVSVDLFQNHQGQQFFYVIQGNVFFMLDDKEYEVKKGDSIYFNSKVSHVLTNRSGEQAELIWVVTPPNF